MSDADEGQDTAPMPAAPNHFAPAELVEGLDVPPGSKVFLVRWTDDEDGPLGALEGASIRMPKAGRTATWSGKAGKVEAVLSAPGAVDGGAGDALALLPRAGEASGAVRAVRLSGVLTLRSSSGADVGAGATTVMRVPVDTTTGPVGVDSDDVAGLVLGGDGGVWLEAARLTGGAAPVGGEGARPLPLAERLRSLPSSSSSSSSSSGKASKQPAGKEKKAKKAKKAKK